MGSQQEEILKSRNAELEAELAVKNRALEIEAALERVRSRAIAMRKTDELLDAAERLYHELVTLGITSLSVTYSIMAEDEKSALYYGINPVDGKIGPKPFLFLHTETEVMRSILRSWKKQEPIHTIELDEEGTLHHQTYIGQQILSWIKKNNLDMPFSVESFIAVSPKKAFINTFNFSQGYIFIIGGEKLTGEQQQIMLKFTKVFELTYRRFLDLQKAEAQAREGQIEAALERVRSRSMAMQKSGELKEVIQVVFEQFAHINIKIEHTGFVMDYKARDDYNIWIADPLGVPSELTIPYFDSVYYNQFNEAKEKGLDFFATNLGFEEKNKFYKKLFEYIPGLPEQAKEFYFSCPGLAASTVLLDNVGLYIENFSGVAYSDEENATLMRFGKVFQQAYARFLDLEKAEAQARESQIQLALERVRARTMAMQRSQELTEVATILFQQVKALGVPQWTCGFNIWEIGDTEFTFYPGSPDGDILFPCRVSLMEDTVFRLFDESHRRGDELCVYESKGAVQAEHYRYMLGLTGGLGDLLRGMLDAGLSLPEFQIDHMANFSHGNLLFITYEHFPEMHDIFKRFAKVFEQTYTRFLDLKKAEALAVEALKQASLDRIRGQVASMRSADDLERMIPLLSHELGNLGIPFIRCGVFIINEPESKVNAFLSTPEGHSLGLLHLPFDSGDTVMKMVEHWRRHKIFIDHWNKAQFLQWMQTMVDMRQTPNAQTLQGTASPPESLHLHFIPFGQGMLYVGNADPLSHDQTALVKSLADTFSIAYARYEDFTKLEQAKESIESALSELKATQSQLVQSEKMASLGELTAGIAHEIQNPLNFVNNFSELSNELIDEMEEEIGKGHTDHVKAIVSDLKLNLDKINHHGKRADAIVKGMLQHSRSSTGDKQMTDINALADEYLRLAFHGMRAKDNTFNAGLETDFDKEITGAMIIPQDIGRVLLNLYNNAFYAVGEKARKASSDYKPEVSVRTKSLGTKMEIRVSDNGNGIPEKVKDKIFQPFFTTKPTGQGTGLGLSLSYDIIKAHGGEIEVRSVPGEGTEFIIQLPVKTIS